MKSVVFSFVVLLSCANANAQQYDASRATTTLFQDSVGTIQVTAAGQPVGLMRDTSASGLDLSQPVNAQRCTFQVDAHGHGFVDCEKSHCLYSPSTFTASTPAWIVAGYTVIGTDSSSMIFGARKANNAVIQVASGSNFDAQGGVVDPVLGMMMTQTADASVSQGVVTLSDALTGNGIVSVSMNNGTPWSKSIPITASYTLPGLRVGINTESTGNACGSANAVHFYGGAIIDAPTVAQMTAEVSKLKSDTGIASLEGQTYDIFPIWGQSNASGKGNATMSTTIPFGVAAEFEDGALKPLADPSRHYATSPAGSVSATGSMWPAFAAAYYAATGRHALIVGAAVKGVGITTTEGGGSGWLGNPEYRAFLATQTLAAQAFIKAHGGTATIKAVVFEDGEADGFVAVAPATFAAGMAMVRADINSRLGLPNLPLACISIDKSTDPTQAAGFAAIRGAINNFCTTQPNAFMIAGYQDFADAGELIDNIHWNQTALNFDGNLAGKTIATQLQQ